MYVDDDLETVADSLGGDIVVAGPEAAVADRAGADAQPRVVGTGNADNLRDAVDVTLLTPGHRSAAGRAPEQDSPTGAQTRQSGSSAGVGGAFDTDGQKYVNIRLNNGYGQKAERNRTTVR